MHARSMMMFEELAKAILFLVMAIFVFIFLAKLFSTATYIPGWSKSLSNIEKAVDTLSEKEPEITRTATVLLKKGEYIKGYKKEDSMCPEGAAYCICACTTSDCSNAAKSQEKFCKALLHETDSGFLIKTEDEKPITYTFSLIKEGANGFRVKAMGLYNS